MEKKKAGKSGTGKTKAEATKIKKAAEKKEQVKPEVEATGLGQAAPKQIDTKDIVLPDWFYIYPENGEVYRISTKFALGKIAEKGIKLINQKTKEEELAIIVLMKVEDSLEAEDLFFMAVSELEWVDLRIKAQKLAYEKHLSLQESFPTARKSFAKVK